MMYRLLPVVLIILAAAIGFLYIYPTYTNTITAAEQQIASYESALKAAQTFSQKESDLLGQENAIAPADLARLQTYLPDGVDNIQLVVDLNALAKRYGLTLSGFSIQDNSSSDTTNPASAQVSSLNSSGTTNSLDLSVSATGTYDAFQAFLASAEQSERPLDITHLTLKDSLTGVYTYNITFRIYWLQ